MWELPNVGYRYYENQDEHNIIIRSRKKVSKSNLLPIEKGAGGSALDEIYQGDKDALDEFLLGSDISAPFEGWALYSALLGASQKFCEEDIPSGEAEPVLTGAFVTRIKTWLEQQATRVQGEEGVGPDIQLAHANTTSGNIEKLTGSDFGLILRVGDNSFKSLLIQVKKVKSGNADVSQMAGNTDQYQREVLNVYEGLGHYLFLHDERGSHTPPLTMCSAQSVVDYCQANSQGVFPSLENGFDAPLYLAFGPFCQYEMIGVENDDPQLAVDILFAGCTGSFSKKIMVLDVGGDDNKTLSWTRIDWTEKVKVAEIRVKEDPDRDERLNSTLSH